MPKKHFEIVYSAGHDQITHPTTTKLIVSKQKATVRRVSPFILTICYF